MTDLLDMLPNGNRIGELFAMMEIAEDEIAKAKRRHPKYADAIHNAFQYMCPQNIAGWGGAINTDLYRHHCRQICDRIATGEDINLATDAELLLAMKDVSLAAPINNEGKYIYFKLFAGVFPSIAKDIVPADISFLERNCTMADQTIADMRRKLKSKNRSVG
jgi:hypothetical protein